MTTETECPYCHAAINSDCKVCPECNEQINFSADVRDKPVIQIRSKMSDNTKLTFLTTISMWILGITTSILGYIISNINNVAIGLIMMFTGLIILFSSVLYSHYSKNK